MSGPDGFSEFGFIGFRVRVVCSCHGRQSRTFTVITPRIDPGPRGVTTTKQVATGAWKDRVGTVIHKKNRKFYKMQREDWKTKTSAPQRNRHTVENVIVTEDIIEKQG